MTDEEAKVAFASPEWIDIARTALEELVAAHGETDKSFSVCEVFTDAPADLTGADTTTVAWHFRIVGKTVTVGEGEISDADMPVRADYQTILPIARLVYTPELIAQRQQNASQVEEESTIDRSNMPTYLVELHNRMAVITK